MLCPSKYSPSVPVPEAAAALRDQTRIKHLNVLPRVEEQLSGKEETNQVSLVMWERKQIRAGTRLSSVLGGVCWWPCYFVRDQGDLPIQ